MDNENVTILKQAYAMWNDSKADSVGHWLELMADDVKLRSLGAGAPGLEFSKTCGCKDDVLNYFKMLGGEWEMIHYTVDEYIAQGDRVVMVGHCGWTNKKTGKVVETPKVDIIRMKDAKIVEFLELYDTAQVQAATRA